MSISPQETAAVLKKLRFQGNRLDRKLNAHLLRTVLILVDERCKPLTLVDLLATSGPVKVPIAVGAENNLEDRQDNNTARAIVAVKDAIWAALEPLWQKAVREKSRSLQGDAKAQLADNSNTPANVLDELANDGRYLEAVLGNSATSKATLTRVYNDKKLAVVVAKTGRPNRRITLMYLAAHPNLPLALYRKMAQDPGTHFRVLDWLLMNKKHSSDAQALGSIFRNPNLQRFQVFSIAVKETTASEVLYAIASNRRLVDYGVLNGLIFNLTRRDRTSLGEREADVMLAIINNPKVEEHHLVAIASHKLTPAKVLYGMACVPSIKSPPLVRICWHPAVETRTLLKLVEHKNTHEYGVFDKLVYLTPRDAQYGALTSPVLAAIARHPKALQHTLLKISNHPKASAGVRRLARQRAPRAPRK